MSASVDGTTTESVIGQPLDRIDGQAKVTGGAAYTADAGLSAPLHGLIVQSTIARGRIREIDESAARAVPGVVEVLTYRNAPHVPVLEFDFTGVPAAEQLAPLQSDEIHYDGQHVALVIAETFEAAREGAAVLRIAYEAGPAVTRIEEAGQIDLNPVSFGEPTESHRGDAESAFAAAAVKLDKTYRTPAENHNPLEPSATSATWDGDELLVHDTTQWVMGTRAGFAAAFELDEVKVRVLAPYLGGGFGCKGFFWPHAILAALGAKVTGRSVKLVLAREQMFTSCGHRSETQQHLRLGATADGKLTAIVHDVLCASSRVGMQVETAGKVSPMLFACENVSMSHRVARLDIPTPTSMRAPGEATGSYALGCAMDELAERLGLDPLELLRRNHAERDGESGKPFSGKHLLECYARGAERFGWAQRSHAPRSMRDGGELIGWGVATATYPALRFAANARVTVGADGAIEVASATHDLGTGMYTIAAQIAADGLGVDPRTVHVRIGDSLLPRAPVAGGSMSSASVGPAIADGAARLRRQAVAIATSHGASPLHGLAADAVEVRDGVLRAKDEPARMLSYADVVRLSGTSSLEALGVAGPGKEQDDYSLHSFGAQFCEVRYDEELARLRVTRLVGVFDCGRVLNHKTARSQMIGGITWGLGMALMEETVRDHRYGAVVTNNLADYHVPVNADVPEIDVLFVEEPDYTFNPLGARGMGEIGITGVAAAVANAVYHASGVRVRDLPIVPEKLLAGAPVTV
jgi:xanthine dehydrogenase YagR molybdenum-binding subunit